MLDKEKMPRKNRIQKYLFGLLVLTLFLCINEAHARFLGINGLHAGTLSYSVEDKAFTGTVTPILSSLVRYGFNDLDRGIITYSTVPGQFVYGPILDSKGNVIKKGDLLIKLESNYHRQGVKAAEANVRLAEAELVFCTKNFKRAIQLGKKTNVISKQEYDTYVAQYEEAIADLDAAKQALVTAQTLYSLIHERAVFDGLVTKVYEAGGLLNNEPPVLQLAALNPMGIKIELDHSIAKKLNNINNTVKVYPVRGNRKATGILLNMTKLTDDGIMLAVENYLISPKLKNPNTPIVNNAQPVLKLHIPENINKPLAVPSVSLAEDTQGSYVWQLVGNKDVQPGKGLSNIYKAKKVYVKPGPLIKRINNHVDYRALDNAGNLSQYDLVLIVDNLPESLKDNDEVCLAENKYLFMPGDKIKIEFNK